MIPFLSPINLNIFPKNFPNTIQKLIQSLSQHQYLTPELVRQLIMDAKIEERDLLPWATYNHPVTDSYGRKLVYDGKYFEIMVMSWLPGDVSAIHDHGYTQWGAVKSFGEAKHITYRLKDNLLQTQKEMNFRTNQILTVNHDLIHQMGNYSNSPFLSIHVYGCYNRSKNITGDARIFDLLENSIQYTDGGVFFCLPENQIKKRQYNINGDLPTTLRHHEQILNRINIILENNHNYAPQLVLKKKFILNKIKELKLLV